MLQQYNIGLIYWSRGSLWEESKHERQCRDLEEYINRFLGFNSALTVSRCVSETSYCAVSRLTFNSNTYGARSFILL